MSIGRDDRGRLHVCERAPQTQRDKARRGDRHYGARTA